MQRYLGALAVLIGLSSSANTHAEGQIYLCIDAAGHKELTDINKKGRCKSLDLPGAITAPPRRTAPSAPRAGPAALPAAPSPADFPKVDNASQKARDSDRRQILQDELSSEQLKLAELKKESNGNEADRNSAKYLERAIQMKDNLGRAEKNVEALKREIANIR